MLPGPTRTFFHDFINTAEIANARRERRPAAFGRPGIMVYRKKTIFFLSLNNYNRVSRNQATKNSRAVARVVPRNQAAF